MEVEISNKYKPLFTLFQDNQHKDVDTVIITGGRYSLKSYTVSIFALAALVYYGWNVLYTRFTNMSIFDSIKPELTGIENIPEGEECGITGKEVYEDTPKCSQYSQK